MKKLMKIILKANIKGLGNAGEIKQVATGYAMNFLIPKALAQVADKATVQKVNEQKTVQQKKVKNQQLKLERVSKALAKKEFQFKVKAAAAGKLYSGLSAEEIIERLRKDYSDIPESAELIEFQPIKEVGDYELRAKLLEDLIVNFTIHVTAN